MRVSEATPRFETLRTPGRRTVGGEVAAIAAKLGQPFMPWQEQWTLVAGELIRDEETGMWVPAYPEAFSTLMRQQGKTLTMLAQMLQRALLWQTPDRKPQAIAYTGQTGLEARKKFRKEHWPLISRSPLAAGVEKPRFMAEDTGIDFKNGAILTLWSNSPEAGHGSVVDLGVMDEIWADTDDRREQALIPATATRADRQKLISSTAGTQASVLYARKRAAGRAAVEQGRTEGMAYLEFSADPDDPQFDPEDPALWRRVMPALGPTITERSVQSALDEMRRSDGDLSEFCRAWLNIPKQVGSSRLVPEEVWGAVLDEESAPSGRCVIAVDGQPNQESASIAVCDADGNVEVVAHGDGVTWVAERAAQIAAMLNAPVVVDVRGPVGHLVEKLTDAGVKKVIEYSSQDVMHACAVMFDAVNDGTVKVRPNYCAHCGRIPITAAVEGVVRQAVGEAWKWSRKSPDVDISPLMAATLAYAEAIKAPVATVPLVAWTP